MTELLVPGPFVSGDLDHVRYQVSSHATTWKLPDHACFVLALIADELITNVIVHGGGAGRLRLLRRGRRVYCQVSDFGPGLVHPHRAGWQPPSVSDPWGGRGLWTVRMFCERLTIDSSQIGTTITASLIIDG